jgi:hypothetical protein
MNRYLFWTWAVISVCWVIFVIAPNWSGADIQKIDEPPIIWDWRDPRPAVHWGQLHRGCRDRLAFWPDGTHIDDSDLTPMSAVPEDKLTDRERWARGVWNKVTSCEVAEYRSIRIQELHRDLLRAALIPPAILLFLGAAIAFVWKHYGETIIRNFPRVPRHIRRGLIRLYLVVAIPWIAWFGYKAYLDFPNAASERAILALPVVPVGAPILYFVVLWIAAGFRKRAGDQADKA